ncbi:MAG TPA: hypothetical protein VFY29_15960 [Terriglobia bacterium]|nr:hypothetical protein [Terriglobia bacterium]
MADSGPAMNYFNYFTEIENFFQTRRETFTLCSPLDWAVIEVWKEQGIPLETVLKGMDRAFSKARRKVNSLAYCVGPVAEVVEEEKETRVERPETAEISSEESRRYLNEIAARVAATAERFSEFQSRINAVADSVRAVDASDFRQAELALTALEERLIAILKIACDEQALFAVQREVDAALTPFRSTMTTPQLATLEQQLLRRTLLEAHDIPRLSLFYLV